MDVYRISEVDSIEHSLVLVFDVDAVMEHHATLISSHLAECEASLAQSVCSHGVQVGQINALFIRNVQVVVQMEVEPWHDGSV